ncbi:hypothetical protein BB560_001485 [Smittium megazygosporum]|uniref:Uncharacterized protein n=1 Tax=Smittium megazygosporum TaxID=133381 RepID=A0A2T9ZHE7_9FUNG|nr:hypothetical protein BB560_001485 [Smittium megazygosporum]
MKILIRLQSLRVTKPRCGISAFKQPVGIRPYARFYSKLASQGNIRSGEQAYDLDVLSKNSFPETIKLLSTARSVLSQSEKLGDTLVKDQKLWLDKIDKQIEAVLWFNGNQSEISELNSHSSAFEYMNFEIQWVDQTSYSTQNLLGYSRIFILVNSFSGLSKEHILELQKLCKILGSSVDVIANHDEYYISKQNENITTSDSKIINSLFHELVCEKFNLESSKANIIPVSMQNRNVSDAVMSLVSDFKSGTAQSWWTVNSAIANSICNSFIHSASNSLLYKHQNKKQELQVNIDQFVEQQSTQFDAQLSSVLDSDFSLLRTSILNTFSSSDGVSTLLKSFIGRVDGIVDEMSQVLLKDLLIRSELDLLILTGKLDSDMAHFISEISPEHTSQSSVLEISSKKSDLYSLVRPIWQTRTSFANHPFLVNGIADALRFNTVRFYSLILGSCGICAWLLPPVSIAVPAILSSAALGLLLTRNTFQNIQKRLYDISNQQSESLKSSISVSI